MEERRGRAGRKEWINEWRARLIRQQEKVTKLKDKRAKKAERERYEKMALTMHKKRVERLKRKEKRNKMIKS